MRDKLIQKILVFVVGKNLPHLVRLIMTWLGAFILAGPVFDSGGIPLDPALADAAIAAGVPAAAQVQDGLTVGEVFSVVSGMLLIWGSRLMSLVRASRVDWLAGIIGPLIGRSLPSLLRAALVAVSGFLVRYTGEGAFGVDSLSGANVGAVVLAVLSVLFANWFSHVEDGNRNPV